MFIIMKFKKSLKQRFKNHIGLFLFMATVFGVMPLQALGAMPLQVFASFPTPDVFTDAMPSLIGRSIEITPDLEYEEYMLLRERHLGSSEESAVFVPFLIGTPANPGDDGIDGTWNRTVSIGDVALSPIRYTVNITGVLYEAFCVDPHLPGSESPAAPPYQIMGSRNNLLNVLRYGFPNNAALNHPQYDSYVTRVAVAYAGGSIPGNLGGDMQLANYSLQLVNNDPSAHFISSFSPRNYVRINGKEQAESPGTPEGGMIVSELFTITGANPNNPVKFEWPAGTSAGTQLRDAAGTVLAAVPGGWAGPGGNGITGSMSFRIAAPEAVGTAAINVVGINNAYAGQVWYARTTANATQFQQIVFYIPKVSAAAVMQPADVPGGRLRILKTDPAGNALGGAVFTVTGPGFSGPHQVTVPVGGWTSGLLEIGTYTITEVQAPAGFTLSSPASQSVEVTINHTAAAPAIVTFANAPYSNGGNGPPKPPVPPDTGVRIQKIDAISRENIPGAMMRLVGMSANYITLPDGQSISFNNTGINLMQVLTAGAATATGGGVKSTVTDGVWTLQGLPYGFYMGATRFYTNTILQD